MSKPNWDEAPEGATHWGPDTDRHCESWYEVTGGEIVRYLPADYALQPMLPAVAGSAYYHLVDDLVGRPAPWTGEGLPPVGTVCEYFDNKWEWYPAVMSHVGSHLFIVKYQHPEHGQQEACMHIASNDGPISSRLRPIRSHEQIAAEERVRAINEMVGVWKRTMGRFAEEERGLAEMLYDAGYRKP